MSLQTGYIPFFQVPLKLEMANPMLWPTNLSANAQEDFWEGPCRELVQMVGAISSLPFPAGVKAGAPAAIVG